MILGATLVASSCAPAPEDDWSDEPEEFLDLGKADSFNWGDPLVAGNGSFVLQATQKKTYTVGKVPAGRKDVLIKLKSAVDFDMQLHDGTTKVVYRTYGLIKGATKSTATYKGVEITWSGYSGEGTSKGNEYIAIKGTTPCAFTLKVRAWKVGQATVEYSWDAEATPPPPSGFGQRLQSFAQKYANHVVLATKQGKPAIFINTKFSADEPFVKAFHGDFFQMIGGNMIMIWNPAGDNYFHLGLGLDDHKQLDGMFRNKSIRLYSNFHVWDNTLGNFDQACAENEEYEEYLDLVEDPCYDKDQIDRQRTVALIDLTDAQLKSLNTYLTAIREDFEGTLGPAEYNGGTPPYFGGTEHNCTSWFSIWLNKTVNSAFPTSANPASLLQSVTSGGWGGTLAKELVGLLVFNHPTPPQAGATIPASFPLEFGH